LVLGSKTARVELLHSSNKVMDYVELLEEEKRRCNAEFVWLNIFIELRRGLPFFVAGDTVTPWDDTAVTVAHIIHSSSQQASSWFALTYVIGHEE